MDPESLEDLKEKIDLFLLGLQHPVLTEPGKEVIDLSTGHYSLSTDYHKLLCHVWNEHTNFVRQITGIRRQSPARMELQFQKFGKGRPGVLILAESRASANQLELRGRRTLYSKNLRRVLAQLFPHWKVSDLRCEANLEHSFSGRYARGLLKRGQQAWAVMGVGEQEDPSSTEGILTYGVIWLDWLRRRHPTLVIEGLKIFVPTGRSAPILHRMSWMDSHLAQWEVYETGDEIRSFDPKDVGNLKTTLAPVSDPPPLPSSTQSWIERIEALDPAIETRYSPDGFRVLSVRGLAFAKETPQGVVFGIERSETPLREQTFGALQALMARILRFRRPQPDDRMHPYFRLQPERWMQSLLMKQIPRLGYDLVPDMVYEQVPAVSGTERGLMDLLAVNGQGRLAVVELKASEDIHLPLQALDYWMRVHWHEQRGEFERQRYFGGRVLSSQAPLLLLVSPALQFHSACETILRYFSPSIEVVRIGLNEEWREALQVVFRAGRQ